MQFHSAQGHFLVLHRLTLENQNSLKSVQDKECTLFQDPDVSFQLVDVIDVYSLPLNISAAPGTVACGDLLNHPEWEARSNLLLQPCASHGEALQDRVPQIPVLPQSCVTPAGEPGGWDGFQVQGMC